MGSIVSRAGDERGLFSEILSQKTTKRREEERREEKRREEKRLAGRQVNPKYYRIHSKTSWN